MDSILSFLKTLGKHNDREWFEKNKGKYLQARDVFNEFVLRLYDDLVVMDESLAGLNPKKLVFRIYRDVRFSKDKRPYKTNFAAAFSRVGKGLGSPGYYLHIEPGNKSFVAGGVYMPDAQNLAKIRQEIDYNGGLLKDIMSNRKFRKWYNGFWDGDQLKTIPRGYPKDHPDAALLKLRSFITSHEFSDAAVKEKKFRKDVINAFTAVRPLNSFLNEALS